MATPANLRQRQSVIPHRPEIPFWVLFRGKTVVAVGTGELAVHRGLKQEMFTVAESVSPFLNVTCITWPWHFMQYSSSLVNFSVSVTRRIE